MQRAPIVPLAQAQLPAYVQMMSEVFNAPRAACELSTGRMDAHWVVAEDARIQAGFGIYRCAMHMCGADVPVAAVAGVAVAPEARGGGLAGGMMAAALDAFRAEGLPIAALYASTLGLYRKVGYEQAGTRVEHRIRTDAIGLADRRLPVRRVEGAEIAGLVRAWGVVRNGQLVRSEGLWARVYSPFVGVTQSYIVGDGEGWAVIWQDTTGPHVPWKVRDWGWRTPAAARRLWTLLADAGTMNDHVQWPGPPTDPMETLLPAVGTEVVGVDRWMVRIVDLPGALTARGWAEDGAIDLDIQDETMPENAGRWQLQVRDRRATVVRGGEGTTAMHIRALASLYTGWHTPDDLAAIGMIDDPGGIGTLFRAPLPWCADTF